MSRLAPALALLLCGSTAHAGIGPDSRGCPWAVGTHEVTIVGNQVTIDGTTYLARGFGRNTLERDMKACSANPAATTHLAKWQRKRRNAWITGTVGAVFLWPLWVLTGAQVHSAVQNRKALEATLESRRTPLSPTDA